MVLPSAAIILHKKETNCRTRRHEGPYGLCAKEIYSSIFSRGDYSVSINTDSPLIIDCGAHIGLATIYFKKKFPSSKITAIEANPETLSFLRKNIKANKIKDVEVIWGALTKKTGILPLYVDPDNANPWSWDDGSDGRNILLRYCRDREQINNRMDDP